jgi:3-oxoacyl-ACP reductase-like protein
VTLVKNTIEKCRARRVPLVESAAAKSNKGVCVSDKKAAIITGASHGIGAGLVAAFLKEGYSAVATSRNVSQSLTPSPSLVLFEPVKS